MNFDKYLKQQAKKDILSVPQKYGERIDNILKSLVPVRTYAKQTRKHNPKLRVAAIVVAVVLAVGGTALAVGYVLKMQGSDIGFFEGAQKQDFASQQEYWEDTSVKVEATVPNQQSVTGDLGAAITDRDNLAGVALTIDNIAMDMNYIHIFYTLTSERPFGEVMREGMGISVEEYGDLGDEEWMRTAVFLRPQIDGKEILPFFADGRSGQGYFKDEHTYTGTASYALVENVPEVFALTVGTNHLLYNEGKWEANFEVDLTGVFSKSKVAYPQQTISVRDAQGIEHEVSVKRVSLTPNGGMVVLEEKTGEDQTPYVDFLVMDKDGNSLSRAILGGTNGGGEGGTVCNILEFSADTDIDSVLLVPYTVDYEKTEEVRVMFDETGREKEIFPGASVMLAEVAYDAQTEFQGEIDTDNSIALKYIEKGVPVGSPAKSRFLNADEEEVPLRAVMTPEIPYRDFATGMCSSWAAVEFEDEKQKIEDLKGMIFEYFVPVPDTDKGIKIEF